MRHVTKRLSILIYALVTLGLSPALLAQPEIQAINDGNGILAEGYSADVIASMSIRVVGPDGFVFEDRVEDSVIDWRPEGELADGVYNWETRMVIIESSASPREDPMLYSKKQATTGKDDSAVKGDSPQGQAQPQSAEQETRNEIPLERFFDDQYKQLEKESGRFRVRDGFIEPIGNSADELSDSKQPGLIGSIAGAALDFLIPSAHADDVISDDLTLEEATPCLRYDDTDTVGGTDWNACGYADGYFVNDGVGGAGVANAQFAIEEGAPASSLYIRAINSSLSYVGLGTNSPTADLHIADGTPRIRIEDTTEDQSWYVDNTNAGRFEITENASYSADCVGDSNTDNCLSHPFTIAPVTPGLELVQDNAFYLNELGNIGLGTDTPQNRLDIRGTLSDFAGIGLSDTYTIKAGTPIFSSKSFRISEGSDDIFRIDGGAPEDSIRVSSDGNVGIGTGSPDFSVDVLSDSGLGQIRITETNGSNGLTMFALENTGHPRFRLRNSDLNSNWDFRTAGSDASNNEQFQITNISNGESNRLFRIFKNGDLEVEGDVTANGVLLTSSKASKTDFAPLDENEVLDNLSQLQITKWRYKHEKEGTQHFGPIAEEFHEIFGLSDGKHLNMVDVGGIAFAAIQALHNKNATLEQQNEQLMKRLDRLEKAIQ